jgi:hypothetical protein
MIFNVFHGYMDESGTHAGSEVVAVAGYLATFDNWLRFESEWCQAMRLYCVEDFHMSEFEGHFKEFGDNNYWTPEIRTRLIERVCQMCEQHSVLGLGCAVVRDDYERALPSDIQDEFRDPYYYCLYTCLQMLVAHRDDTRIDALKPINFLFDRKDGRFRLGSTMVGWQAYATEVFDRIKPGLDELGHVIGELTFGKRVDYPELRAADLLVYETGKLYRQWLNEPSRPLRKSMRHLLKRKNLLITFQTQVKLRNYIRVVEGVQRGETAAAIGSTLEKIDPEAEKMTRWMRTALAEKLHE